MDYLLKPIEPDRLATAIEKVFSQISAESSSSESPLTREDRVFVKDGDRCWFVILAEVGCSNQKAIIRDSSLPMRGR